MTRCRFCTFWSCGLLGGVSSGCACSLLCSFGGVRFRNHVGKRIVLHFGNIFATFQHRVEVFFGDVPAAFRPKYGFAHRSGKVAHALFLGTRDCLAADCFHKPRLDFGILAEEHSLVRHFIGVLGVVLLAVNPNRSEKFTLTENDIVRLDHFEHCHERYRCDNRVRIVVEQVFKKRTSMHIQEVVDGLLTVLNGHVVQFNMVDRLGNLCL